MAVYKNQDMLDFLKRSNTPVNGSKFKGKSPVIKNMHARQSEQGSVRIPVRESGGSDQPQVEPILEGGLIVGIQFTCTCHRTTEIRFEYEDTTPARSGRDEAPKS